MSDLTASAAPVQDVRAAIREAAAQVLETMFFVTLSDAEPAEEPAWPPTYFTARILVEGDRSGAFSIRLPECMARTVAANFLAEDEDALTVEQIEEVVREFANMVCGASLSAVAPQATLNLSPPHLHAGVPPQGDVYTESIYSDCGRMEMQLEFWPRS